MARPRDGLVRHPRKRNMVKGLGQRSTPVGSLHPDDAVLRSKHDQGSNTHQDSVSRQAVVSTLTADLIIQLFTYNTSRLPIEEQCLPLSTLARTNPALHERIPAS